MFRKPPLLGPPLSLPDFRLEGTTLSIRLDGNHLLLNTPVRDDNRSISRRVHGDNQGGCLCLGHLLTRGTALTASRQGQDKRGRRRSAAIPPYEFSWLSWDNVGKIWKCITTCGNMCALKLNITKCVGFVAPL